MSSKYASQYGHSSASGVDGQPPLKFLVTALLRIEGNLLWCERRPLALTGTVLHLLAHRIVANEVVGGRQGGIVVLGIAAAGASTKICDNGLSVTGSGIAAGVDGLWIEGNKVSATGDAEARVPGSAGIALATGLDPNGIDQCQLLANQVGGFDGAGIRIAAATEIGRAHV